MASTPVPITGEVLQWAMADAGVSRQTLARHLGVSGGTVQAWEEGVEEPTTSQFRQLAKRLARPESFFFLPRPPRRRQPAAQFRRLADAEAEVSADEARIVRQARKMQQSVSWIRTRESPELRVHVPFMTSATPPAEAAAALADWLDWSTHTRASAGRTESGTRSFVRGSLQQKGILTIHVSLSDSEIRGFALPDPIAPLIAVNTADSNGMRLFSYAHELAHLALNEGSVCLNPVHRGKEQWCNRVAAALLMPAAEFKKLVVTRLKTNIVSSVEDVRSLARYYGLSLRAVAVRLEDLGLAVTGLYSNVAALAEFKKRGGSPDPDRLQTKPRVKLQQLGRAYGIAILEAEASGLLTNSQAIELVGVSRAEYAEFRSLVLAGVEG
ncbi:XRE family transcriptional regulator [Actinocatenispora sera]|uniref:XRE family transcriptional regulator n=1 Tax=Actinocatenispora sera TaxID=390989 RepID=UPI0033C89350